MTSQTLRRPALSRTRAVLPSFRRQGFGGLINVGSILSKVGQSAKHRNLLAGWLLGHYGRRGLRALKAA